MLVALHVKHKQNLFFFFFPIFGNYHFSTAVPKSLLQQVDPCRSLQWSLGYWILSFGSSHTLNYLMYMFSPGPGPPTILHSLVPNLMFFGKHRKDY